MEVEIKQRFNLPGASSSYKPNPEAIRLWDPNFARAKDFLQSPAWNLFSDIKEVSEGV